MSILDPALLKVDTHLEDGALLEFEFPHQMVLGQQAFIEPVLFLKIQ